jgi:hypothetical protein
MFEHDSLCSEIFDGGGLISPKDATVFDQLFTRQAAIARLQPNASFT